MIYEVSSSLQNLQNYFQFTFTIILKTFQKYLNELEKKKYFPNVSLDTNFSFEMFDTIQNQMPFETLEVDFFNESQLHPEFTIDNDKLASHIDVDAKNSILNLISSMPTIHNNLLSAYLQTNINYKNTFLQKQEKIIELYKSTFTIFYETTKMFLTVYNKNIENQKNKFKEIIKEKIKNYLKNTYIQFLKQVLVLFSEISNLENVLGKQKKEFSKDLETRFIESKLYIKELEILAFNNKNKNNNTENINNENTNLEENGINNIEPIQAIQIHELNKIKQVNNNFHNVNQSQSSSILLLQQMEQDLKKSRKPMYNYTVEKTVSENLDKEQLKGILQNLKLQLYEYENNFLDIKEDIRDIMDKTYKDFSEKQTLEKNETIKIILQEFTPYLKSMEENVNGITNDLIKKLKYQETILHGLHNEIEEQKKQYKDFNLKLDLCTKSFKDQSLTSIQSIKNKSFYELKKYIHDEIKKLVFL